MANKAIILLFTQTLFRQVGGRLREPGVLGINKCYDVSNCLVTSQTLVKGPFQNVLCRVAVYLLVARLNE